VDWIDFGLNVVVLAIVPFALAAYGGHLAAGNIPDINARRKAQGWFWTLCLLGIVIAALSQYRFGRAEDARNRRTSEADQHAQQAQAELAESERINGDKLLDLQGQINKLLMRPQSREQKIDALKLKDEIAAAVVDKVKPQVVIQQPPLQTLPSPSAPQTLPSPSAPQTPKPCRGDALEECSDDQLLEWGKPLVANAESIVNDYMADLKKLDDIKGGNWLGALVGIGDKDSKWLKAHAEAEEKAAATFRDCCAENALAYHKELVQRTGAGLEKNELYEWIQNLMKPIQAKEYKKAKENGGNVVYIVGDLHQLQFELQRKAIRRH